MILDGVAGISILLALLMAFGWAPTDATLGHLQRIFYFHVSTAWVGFLALFIGLVGGLLYLRRGEARFDSLSQGLVEIGFTFISVAIVTGSIWAKPVWNTWWTWEPRLTTAAILWLIYLAYFMLRRGINDPERGARLSAVYTIPAFVSVPLTFLAIFLWRGMHPVMGGLAPRMLITLLTSVGAFTLLYLALLRHRMRLAYLSREIASLREQLEERGLMVYLIAACGVVWAGTLLYLLHLSWQERALERELKRLQARLSAPDWTQGPKEGG